MNTGRRTERFTILQITETADSEGQPIPTPTTLATVWGSAKFLESSSREFAAAQKINTEISWKFTINRRRDVTVKMQVSWRSPVGAAAETWNIHAIEPSMDKSSMNLMVSRVK